MRNLIVSILLPIFVAISLPWQPVKAGFSEDERQGILFKNLLDPWCGGFECGAAAASGTPWTIGTDTTSGDTSTPMSGNISLTWDSAGAARILASKAVTIPTGLYGANGLAQCNVITASGTSTHTLTVFDGTNTLATATWVSSTLPTTIPVNFIFPSSGTIQLRITSVNANEPSIEIDDCYIGAAANISNVSQATFIGSAKIAATTNCTPAVTNTSLTSFSTDTDCPGPTVISNPGPGTIQTTDTDLPKFTVNSLPPGIYRTEICGFPYNGTSGQDSFLAVTDGVTTTPTRGFISPAASRGSTVCIEGWWTYTTTANQTFELKGAAGSGTITLEIQAGIDMTFSITRFPSTSEQAFRPDVGPSSWSGYNVVASCAAWTVTQSTYAADFAADADCNLTERLNRNFGTVTNAGGGAAETPGIVFTPTRVGFYRVCAVFAGTGTPAGTSVSFKLWDGTTDIAESGWSVPVAGYSSTISLCGLYNATSIAAKTISIRGRASANAVTLSSPVTSTATIEWSIEAIDFSMNTPLLTQSIVGGTSGQAIAREEWGDAYTTASGTVCSANPCTAITSNGISSVGRTSTGIYTINFSPAFAVAPVCNFISTNAFRLFDQTGATTSVVTMNSDTGTIAIPVAADSAFTFRCIGVR